jgi:DNA-binding transcriptional MerR regulator
MEKKFLTAKQAAALLHVTDRTLLRWRKRKLLLPKTVGGKLLYDMEDIEKALRSAE